MSRWTERLRGWPRAPLLWLAALAIALTSTYWLLLASNRYASEARVMLSRAELAGGQSIDFASLVNGSGGHNRGDHLLLRDHLRSIDTLRQLDARLQLRQHYSRNGDWFSRLHDEQAPIEEFQDHFLSRVSIELDEFAGVLVIQAQAYTPEMAEQIASALLEQGERRMNALGHEMAQEQVNFLQQQVDVLNRRAGEARAALLAYQNRKGLLSPQGTAENVAAIVARLEGQLAELQTRRSGLQSFLQPQAPQLAEVNAQIAATEQQLVRERGRLAGPDAGTLNRTVDEYQRLQQEADLAQRVLGTALTSLERGRIDASRTLQKVQVLQSPHRPEFPLYPRRLYQAAVYALVILLVTGVLQLLLVIVRDHQD